MIGRNLFKNLTPRKKSVYKIGGGLSKPQNNLWVESVHLRAHTRLARSLLFRKFSSSHRQLRSTIKKRFSKTKSKGTQRPSKEVSDSPNYLMVTGLTLIGVAGVGLFFGLGTKGIVGNPEEGAEARIKEAKRSIKERRQVLDSIQGKSTGAVILKVKKDLENSLIQAQQSDEVKEEKEELRRIGTKLDQGDYQAAQSSSKGRNLDSRGSFKLPFK